MIEPNTDAIRCDVDEYDEATVVRVTLDRPAKRNSLTPAATADLIDCVESIESADGDAVVVSGAADTFCTGADVTTLDPGGDGGFEAGLMQRLVDAVRACPLPVVSRVDGQAFGAGFMLCMASDVVLATEDATFGLQEVNLGMPVEGYVTTLLPRIVGEHRAREWILTGSLVSAERARDAGFVSRVVPDDDLDDAVAEFAADFAGGSSAAIAALKARMADPVPTTDLDAVREREQADLERAYESDEVEKRIEALLNS